MQKKRSTHWRQLLQQIMTEYQLLPENEKSWITTRLTRIEALQERMNLLFENGQGLRSCADCLGDCCVLGHNHMTLANLLSYLQCGELPPSPDFTSTCPFLGEHGCVLLVARRPYNCISFVCDIIEDALTSAEVEHFYQLDKELRALYLDFSSRFAGGSMTGLLLQYERLAGRFFLAHKE